MGEEELLRRGEDQLDISMPPAAHAIGQDQHVVDRPGNDEAADEQHDDRDQRIDQALAELDQMIEQRRLVP